MSKVSVYPTTTCLDDYFVFPPVYVIQTVFPTTKQRHGRDTPSETGLSPRVEEPLTDNGNVGCSRGVFHRESGV